MNFSLQVVGTEELISEDEWNVIKQKNNKNQQPAIKIIRERKGEDAICKRNTRNGVGQNVDEERILEGDDEVLTSDSFLDFDYHSVLTVLVRWAKREEREDNESFREKMRR